MAWYLFVEICSKELRSQSREGEGKREEGEITLIGRGRGGGTEEEEWWLWSVVVIGRDGVGWDPERGREEIKEKKHNQTILSTTSQRPSWASSVVI